MCKPRHTEKITESQLEACGDYFENRQALSAGDDYKVVEIDGYLI